MPFNLRYLHRLTHNQVDAALEYVNCPRPSSHLKCSPYQLLLDVISPLEAYEKPNLRVLAKLLGGTDEELDGLKDTSLWVVASRIFLKFKLFGDKYSSENGKNNTCLHDAILSSAYLTEELTELLIQNGADPALENKDKMIAPVLYMQRILPHVAEDFSSICDMLPDPPGLKFMEFILTTMINYAHSVIPVVKVMAMYDLFTKYPDILSNAYPGSFAGDTILHLAADESSPALVRCLLENGANVHVMNAETYLPIDIAAERAMTEDCPQGLEIVAILLMHALKQMFPVDNVFTVSYLVRQLVALNIPKKGFREQVIHYLYYWGTEELFPCTKQELLKQLHQQLEMTYRPNISDLSLIGSGTFGTVYKGLLKEKNGELKKVAIKFNSYNYDSLVIREEALILSKLDHPNIVRFMGIIEREAFGFVMHYAKNGSLANFIHKKDSPSNDAWFYSIAKQMNAGLHYLHDNGYVHLDFKPDNIVLEDGKVLLTDFGATALAGEIRPNFVTTFFYSSPERFDLATPFHYSNDIFSFGVCLGEMNTLQYPWDELFKIEENGKKHDELIQNQLENGNRTTFNDCPMTPGIAKLVRWCWSQNVSDRPGHDAIDEYLDTVLKV